jgi:hypothetical protein
MPKIKLEYPNYKLYIKFKNNKFYIWSNDQIFSSFESFEKSEDEEGEEYFLLKTKFSICQMDEVIKKLEEIKAILNNF